LFSEEDLTRYFEILLQTDDDVRRKLDPRVHLEMGLLRLVNAARLAPLEELLAEMSDNPSGRARGGPVPRTAAGNPGKPQVTPRPATAGGPSMTGSSESEAYQPQQPGARPASRTAAIGTGGSAAAVAPALDATTSIASAPAVRREIVAVGLTVKEVGEIKTTIQSQQKFIGELLEHASRWELENGELRIYFPAQKSTFAGLIEGRDTLEKIRTSSSKVLARAVRVCARLESGAAKDVNASHAASTQEMRAQFENDPLVKSMLQRFGGRISEVRRRNGE
jgi:DNA polymerase III gamma/tau subunit